jgi:SAM-dependent methyltransferase
VGIDASEYAIGCARARVPGVAFEVSRAGEFPVSGPFDLITAFDVLEHIPRLHDTLSWVAANLRPGGALLFVVPVYDGPLGWLVRRLDRDPTHVHKHGRGFWLTQASHHLELRDWSGVFRYLVAGSCYIHVPGRMYRRFSPAIACDMRRPK